MIEEKFSCFVKQRASGNFGASGNFDEAAFHQGLQNAIDRDAVYGFGIRSRDRVTVSDDGERLERGRTQARRFRRREKSAHPLGVLRIARQLPTVGFFYKLKAMLVLNVFDLQLFNRSGDFCWSNFCKFVGRKFILAAGVMKNVDNLLYRKWFLRAEEERFDYFGERHTRISVSSC